ncbi:MAG: hypothetical protein FJZ47_21505 [Candidatus Tectomicrobia bacterium]|uniref:Uncharacterized protein n=1 Tax=Tectimicrobiota bacterium TaxID=2528274 RepID=A0A938B652_UNCTE|nr:hypothetical protein [Candidatus Tectomicrobia bacterium]
MFERLADFWDIVVFAFVLLMLASLQLRYATAAEAVLAIAALICAVGLLLVKKWAVTGLQVILLLSLLVYFAQIWLQSILHEHAGYVFSNIFKMVIACLLLLYIGREQIERRFA